MSLVVSSDGPAAKTISHEKRKYNLQAKDAASLQSNENQNDNASTEGVARLITHTFESETRAVNLTRSSCGMLQPADKILNRSSQSMLCTVPSPQKVPI